MRSVQSFAPTFDGLSACAGALCDTLHDRQGLSVRGHRPSYTMRRRSPIVAKPSQVAGTCEGCIRTLWRSQSRSAFGLVRSEHCSAVS
jgi:hypothetical protein